MPGSRFPISESTGDKAGIGAIFTGNHTSVNYLFLALVSVIYNYTHELSMRDGRSFLAQELNPTQAPLNLHIFMADINMADTSLVSLWDQVISFRSVWTPGEDKFVLYYKSQKWGLTRLCSLANNSFTNEHAVFLTPKKCIKCIFFSSVITCVLTCFYTSNIPFKSPVWMFIFIFPIRSTSTQPVFQIAFQASPL